MTSVDEIRRAAVRIRARLWVISKRLRELPPLEERELLMLEADALLDELQALLEPAAT